MGFGKDGKGVIITDVDVITLGTLANVTAIKQGSPLVFKEDFRLIKMIMSMHTRGQTVGEAGIEIYLCNNDLSVAEIAEAIVTAGPLSRNETVAEDLAKRAVFLLGNIGALGVVDFIQGKGGQYGVIEENIRWSFSDPEGWCIVAFNNSGAALTTGQVIRFSVKYFGVWLQ